MKFKLAILMLLVMNLGWGQHLTNLSRSELGVMVGGSYYIGDLNRFEHFKNTHLAGGILYRYNIHSRVSYRANFTYGRISADDASSKSDLYVNRNLSFQSDIFEVGTGFEFNYFPFRIGDDRYKGTAYILAEIAVFKMNPRTEYNGDWVDLQPLGTEGQGSDLSSRSKYSLFQVAIPLGIGCKLSIGKRASINLEYGIRKTFTDYLDDVRSNSFVPVGDLAAANGPLAASLSNRSLDGNRYGKRGNTATKDWYSFFGVMLTFQLGKHQACSTWQ